MHGMHFVAAWNGTDTCIVCVGLLHGKSTIIPGQKFNLPAN